jgi:CheY-like chemotaxis protein
MLSYRQPYREFRMIPVLVPEKPLRMLRSALIVDDHPLFCDALSMTLTGPVGIPDVEAVGTLEAALTRLASGPSPDVVVLDLNLPDVNGLDGVVRLRQAAPETPIVVVSSLDEVRIVRAALKAGINAFVPKHASREEFREAFAVIARGEIHASRLALEGSVPSPLGRGGQAACIADAPAGPHPAACLCWPHEQADRLRAFHRRDDGESACHRHYAQARCADTHAGGAVRAGSKLCNHGY